MVELVELVEFVEFVELLGEVEFAVPFVGAAVRVLVTMKVDVPVLDCKE